VFCKDTYNNKQCLQKICPFKSYKHSGVKRPSQNTCQKAYQKLKQVREKLADEYPDDDVFQWDVLMRNGQVVNENVEENEAIIINVEHPVGCEPMAEPMTASTNEFIINMSEDDVDVFQTDFLTSLPIMKPLLPALQPVMEHVIKPVVQPKMELIDLNVTEEKFSVLLDHILVLENHIVELSSALSAQPSQPSQPSQRAYEIETFSKPNLDFHLLPEFKMERRADPVKFTKMRCDQNILIECLEKTRVYLPTCTRSMTIHGTQRNVHFTVLESTDVFKTTHYARRLNEAASILNVNMVNGIGYFKTLMQRPDVVTNIAIDTVDDRVMSVCITSAVTFKNGNRFVEHPFVISILYAASDKRFHGCGYMREFMRLIKGRVDERSGSAISIQSIYEAVSVWRKYAKFSRFAINMIHALYEFDSLLFAIHENIVEFAYETTPESTDEITGDDDV